MSNSTPCPGSPRRFFSALVLLWALSSAVFAADTRKRSFDLPPGDAERSIRQFSEQAGILVIFPPEVTDDVRTNAVKGEFTATEAGEKLLAGTGLKLFADEKSGVYNVAKVGPSDPNAPRAALGQNSDRPESSRRVSTGSISGRNSIDAAGNLAKGIVELSPFVVATDKDNGYAATSTLAGSRLNTELRDTPAAISVFTKTFLDDIDALNTTEAFSYALNGGRQYTDLTGVSGSESVRDINVQIRGFVAATVTRNYFPWVISGDTYNTERLDFSRGPNAILFGVGSPGGVANTTTKMARFGKPIAAVQFRAGIWDDLRGTIDFGRQVSDTLAVRFNAVDQKKRSWQEFADEDRTGAALAASYKPFRHTELRFDSEYSNVHRVLASPFPAGNAVSSWLAGGKQISTDNATAVSGTVVRNNAGVVYDPLGTTGPLVWSGVRATASGARVASNSNLLTAFSDQSILPASSNLYGPGSKMNSRYYNYSLFLEQGFGALSLELAYNRNYEHRDYHLPLIFNVANLQADPNALLPSAKLPNGQTAPRAGQPNPNAGKFFVESNSGYSPRGRNSNNYRAVLAYKLDPTGRSAWLGTHSLAGLVSRSEDWFWQDQNYEVNITPPGTPTYPTNVTNANNRILRRTYLDFTQGAPSKRGQLDATLYPIDNLNGVTSGYRRVANNYNPSLTNTNSWMLATQSSWWNKRVNVTGGLRRDDQVIYNAGTTALNDPVTGEYLTRPLVRSKPALTGAGDTLTFGGVFQLINGLSFFYNRANNFQPQSSFDVTGAPISAIKGKGEDAGVRLAFWDNKVDLTIDRYKTVRTNQVQAIGNGNALFNDITAIWSAMNEPNRIVGTQPQDSVDNAGKGWEVELVANPTKQWRLSANFSQADLVQTNTYPRYLGYIAANRPTWTQSAGLPLLSIPPGVTVPNPTVADGLRAVDVTFGAILASNGQRPLQSVRNSANVFSTYTFASGPSWLHGVMVGGGANYRGRSVAGYSAIHAGAPITAPGYMLVNAVIGRMWKIGPTRSLRMQLNVNNAMNNQHHLYVDATDSGFDYYRYLQPMSWSLTSTLSF